MGDGATGDGATGNYGDDDDYGDGRWTTKTMATVRRATKSTMMVKAQRATTTGYDDDDNDNVGDNDDKDNDDDDDDDDDAG